MLSKIKGYIESALSFIAELLHKAGFSPSTLSLIGLIFGFFSGFTYYKSNFIFERICLAALLMLISGFFDAIDGIVARKYGEASSFGGLLDSTLDRLSEIAIYFGLILGGLTSVEIGLGALTSSLMVSYVRARAEVEGLKLSGVGLAERPERLIILALFSFLNKIQIGLIIIFFFSSLTIIQRFIYAFKKLKG
ncbi:MAG: CDP-alcohol phosphatidyltransferase family protein [Candidatus Bathyarchaeia archaeon]|nr:CDP-alcohol phosphatidyltransferase family protein [Candidatus Bathyarchaeota archaeon]